MAVDLDLM